MNYRRLFRGCALSIVLLFACLTAQAAGPVILEDFEQGGDRITEVKGGTLYVFNQAWNPASWGEDFKLTIDTQEAVSGSKSLRIEGTPQADYSGIQVFFLDRTTLSSFSPEWFVEKYGTRNLKNDGVVSKDLSNYSKLSVMFRPSINLPPQAVAIRVTVNGVRGDYIYPLNEEPLFADQWAKLEFDLSSIQDRKDTAVIRFYPTLVVTTQYAFNLDDLSVE